MKADTAERLTELALRMSDELNGMVRHIKANEPDELVRLQQAIGRVMWAIYFEILKPTFEEHPSLEPEAGTTARPAAKVGPNPCETSLADHPTQPSAPGSRRSRRPRGSKPRQRR